MPVNQRAVKNRVDPNDPGNRRTTERAAAEARLDAALADSFPASDPVAITVHREPRRTENPEGQPHPAEDLR